MDKKRLTISLDGPDHAAVTRYAGEQQRSLSWVIAKAVKRFLETEQPQLSLQFTNTDGTESRSKQDASKRTSKRERTTARG